MKTLYSIPRDLVYACKLADKISLVANKNNIGQVNQTANIIDLLNVATNKRVYIDLKIVDLTDVSVNSIFY